ncbi:hypothetical protein BDW60DRAFT_154294 [Aspergillus nidulans var. acristatus]
MDIATGRHDAPFTIFVSSLAGVCGLRLHLRNGLSCRSILAFSRSLQNIKMRASLILLAFSALAAAQLSSEPVNQETTATETSIESSTETPTDTVIETPIDSTATGTTDLETATETSTPTTSQPLIPTGTIPEQSTPVIGSSSFTTSPSPTSSTSTRSSSSTTRDSTSTSTATETATSTSNNQDAEETNSDNGAFALPTANPLLGVGLAGAALAAFI